LHEADSSGWSLDEGWRQHADGTRYWGSCLVVPSYATSESLVGKSSYNLIICDISNQQEAYDARQHLLSRDHLTGLSNRRALYEAAELEFQRWNRVPRPLSVAMIDIDHFKQVNDRYGHAAGDEVLRHLTAAMVANFGPMDTIARMGGEEFVALMPGRTVQAATETIECLRLTVETHPVEMGEHSIHYTISAGVAGMDAGLEDVNALLHRADTVMYDAKKNGRNCVRSFLFCADK
jgi:diguanylate cyclase (GGDEF)-like protein